jgi:hypothetical protein
VMIKGSKGGRRWDGGYPNGCTGRDNEKG